MLSNQEFSRYARHLALPGFGVQGQQKLKASRVLVVGAGGLGCPVLQYLAAAGIGTIGIIDHDIVSESNLQRQVLYSMRDVGRLKVEAAKDWILELNPHVMVDIYPQRLTAANALEYFSDYDLIIDCCDNFPTRYIVNDAAVLSGLPYVYGSIFRYEGQLAVFNVKEQNGYSGNYRDLYPQPPLAGEVPSCEEAGVLGVLTGIIGSMQALEAIKLLTGTGERSAGRYLLFDALTLESKWLTISKSSENPLTGDDPTITDLLDYDAFCAIASSDINIRSISAEEFMNLKAAGEDFQLIDVREPEEFGQSNLGGVLIPLAAITENQHLIARDKKVIVHCGSGGRSIKAINRLTLQFGFTNLYNLEGGISAVMQARKL